MSRHHEAFGPCPLYPRKRTSCDYIGALSCKLLGMGHERSRPTQPWAQFLRLTGVLLLAVTLPVPASAQDIQGMEVCTAEKQMERRTGCLQANVEFLQQALTRLTRETQDKMAAAGRGLAAAP